LRVFFVVLAAKAWHHERGPYPFLRIRGGDMPPRFEHDTEAHTMIPTSDQVHVVCPQEFSLPPVTTIATPTTHP
jgi:hypothetical protein